MLADAVMLSHFAFLALLALGSIGAWRWRRLLWLHPPCVGWAFLSLVARAECPLTSVEKVLRVMGGERAYAGGFIDHYLEGVLYPAALAPLVAAGVGALIIIGYAGVWWRERRAVMIGHGS